MRVLSIDWDYFMNTSRDVRISQFPDGGNEKLSAFSDLAWASRYAQSKIQGVDISTIKLREKQLDKVRKIVEANKDTYYYAIVDSHRHLGEFLLEAEIAKKIDEDGLTIVNIDHHSDLYNIGDELNCGNWLNRVMDRFPDTEVKWIANDDSDLDEFDKDKYHITISTSIEDAEGEYDFIYLCRSRVWSCPHLDKDFSAFSRYVKKRSTAGVIHEELPSRWDTEYIRAVDSEYAMLKNLFDKNLQK